jgi:hypothetical protein
VVTGDIKKEAGAISKYRCHCLENKLELSSLCSQLNDGILEKWNDGMAPFGQINACGGSRKDHWFFRHFFYFDNSLHEMLLFHYSIIPLFLFGIKKMVGWRFPIIKHF